MALKPPSLPQRLAKLLDVQSLPAGACWENKHLSLSVLSPFLEPTPWEGQAQLGEMPGLPRKHGVMLGGDFLFDFFFVF